MRHWVTFCKWCGTDMMRKINKCFLYAASLYAFIPSSSESLERYFKQILVVNLNPYYLEDYKLAKY